MKKKLTITTAVITALLSGVTLTSCSKEEKKESNPIIKLETTETETKFKNKTTTNYVQTTQETTTTFKPSYSKRTYLSKENNETYVEKQEIDEPDTPKATQEQIDYVHEYLRENDFSSLIRMMNIQNTVQILKKCNINQNLTKEIENNFNTNLTENEKERYNTLFEKTIKKCEECEYLYEILQLDKANALFEELITNKEYINIDDAVLVYSKAVNNCFGQEIIKNPENYTFENNSIVIDGIKINSVLPLYGIIDFSNPFEMFNHFYEESKGNSDKETINSIKSFTVKVFLLSIIRNIKIQYDDETNEFYTYTDFGLEEVLKNTNELIEENYEIVLWKYDDKNDLYIVYDKNGNLNICKKDSELEESILECEAIKKIVIESEINGSIENIKETKTILEKPFIEKNNQKIK